MQACDSSLFDKRFLKLNKAVFVGKVMQFGIRGGMICGRKTGNIKGARGPYVSEGMKKGFD